MTALTRVSCRNKATTSAAIVQHFLPALGGILGAMCKASCLSAADLAALAGSVLQLHAYFQAYSWDITWASSQVRQLTTRREHIWNVRRRLA